MLPALSYLPFRSSSLPSTFLPSSNPLNSLPHLPSHSSSLPFFLSLPVTYPLSPYSHTALPLPISPYSTLPHSLFSSLCSFLFHHHSHTIPPFHTAYPLPIPHSLVRPHTPATSSPSWEKQWALNRKEMQSSWSGRGRRTQRQVGRLGGCVVWSGLAPLFLPPPACSRQGRIPVQGGGGHLRWWRLGGCVVRRKIMRLWGEGWWGVMN